LANTHEHLPTAQLSALIDKQLSMEEEAICRAHLQTCEQCQGRFAGLQQTAALLRALPQPALPRSFALPTGVRYLQDRPEVGTSPAVAVTRFIASHQAAEQEEVSVTPARRRSWTYYIQRSLRATSTIAAVIGLVFLLSGVLPLLSHSGTTTSGTVPSASSASNHLQSKNQAPADLTATSKVQIAGNGQTTPTVGKLTPNNTPKPANTPGFVRGTPGETGHQNATPPTQAQPPIIDLNTPLGRQVVGFALLFLGIVGVLLTRRRRTKAERQA
jgi:anti-sigma factor RsiW